MPSGIGNKGNSVKRKRKREEIKFGVCHAYTICTIRWKFKCHVCTISCKFPNTISICSKSRRYVYRIRFFFSGQLYGHVENSALMNFYATSGDITVGSPQQPLVETATPHPSSSSEFRLCFRTGNISVCNGCRNRT